MQGKDDGQGDGRVTVAVEDRSVRLRCDMEMAVELVVPVWCVSIKVLLQLVTYSEVSDLRLYAVFAFQI